MQEDDPIILSITLFDGATDKFPQAELFEYDSAFTRSSFSGSPFNLNHLDGGYYDRFGNDLKFPGSIFQVVAIYTVFEDAAHTIVSTAHSQSVDIFTLETPSPTVGGSVAAAVWNKFTADHDIANTFGAAVNFIKDIEGGKWRIVNDQMIFFKADNATEIARFNLFDINQNASSTDVFERRRT